MSIDISRAEPMPVNIIQAYRRYMVCLYNKLHSGGELDKKVAALTDERLSVIRHLIHPRTRAKIEAEA